MKYTDIIGFFDILSYIRRMKVPQEVIQAASFYVESFGPNFRHLGRKGPKEVFLFAFPNEQQVGLPFVYLYEEGKPVQVLTDQEAADVIASFGVE